MARFTDEELACRLEAQQVDRIVLDAAAKRIRECELRTLLHTNDILDAIAESSIISDEHRTAIIEMIVSAVPPNRQTSSRMSSLAARVWRTGEATKDEIRSLAASVMSQDETPGQS